MKDLQEHIRGLSFAITKIKAGARVVLTIGGEEIAIISLAGRRMVISALLEEGEAFERLLESELKEKL